MTIKQLSSSIVYNRFHMRQDIVLRGMVREGQKRGKRLGFPTANFTLSEQVEEGIYISQTEIDGITYNSLTFIGSAKTYNETTYQAETYIFAFDENIYGKEITVTLLKKIRGNQKFASETELIAEMERDKKVALEFFRRGKR